MKCFEQNLLFYALFGTFEGAKKKKIPISAEIHVFVTFPLKRRELPLKKKDAVFEETASDITFYQPIPPSRVPSTSTAMVRPQNTYLLANSNQDPTGFFAHAKHYVPSSPGRVYR